MRGPFFIFLLWVIMVGTVTGISQLGKLAGERMLDESMNAKEMVGMVHTGEGDEKVATKLIGSRPPSCKGKCKGCVPCSPAEVTVPPAQRGSPFTRGRFTHPSSSQSPYYSVAWRCRCKGRDYNP